MPNNIHPQKLLTKKGFERLLEKVFTTPVPQKKPVPAESGTSEPHRPDGCTETCKSPNTPEGTLE